jgi:hypothetical protein
MARPCHSPRRLAMVAALITATAAFVMLFAANIALGDPPNHPRFRASVQSAGPHPEILAGLAPPDVRDHRLIAQLVRADRGSAASGFDWGAASIGAGVALGLTFLVGVAFSIVRRRGDETALPPKPVLD